MMAGKLKPKRGKPWDPAKDGPKTYAGMASQIIRENQAVVTDRRAQEFKIPEGSDVTIMEVDDPFPLNPGDKVVVVRSLRNDPLAHLHSRRYIDDAAYEAGRAYQRDHELAGTGLRAFDYTKVQVSGGVFQDGTSDGQLKAVERLIAADTALGKFGTKLTGDVLIDRMTLQQVANSRRLEGQYWERHFGKKFRECLETLAVVYGKANFEKIVPDLVD
jgi:hypothetical protein